MPLRHIIIFRAVQRDADKTRRKQIGFVLLLCSFSAASR
jgi:hypothetical protein